MTDSTEHHRLRYILVSLGLALLLFTISFLIMQPTRAADRSAPAATTFSVTPPSGAASSTVQFSGCDWGKGEAVDIYFDDPAQKIASTIVTLGGGCFETEGTIPSGADLGDHTITATGDMGNSGVTTFTVTAAQLIFSPDQGPPNSSIEASGCGWNTNSAIDVLWSDGTTVIGSDQTDGQGCFTTTATIPSTATTGIHTLSAEDAGGAATSTNFDVTAPDVALTPDDGPPQSTVTAEGCGWLAGETVSVAWEAVTNTLSTDAADSSGCFNVNVTIPTNPTYGDRTVYAAGGSSGAVATTTFTVRDPGFQFYPDSGPVESNVTAYGCGWVGNTQIDVKWSDGAVMTTTGLRQDGCFDVDVTIPLDAAVGPHAARAEGSAGGVATATFTVSNTATINLSPNPWGSGDEVYVYGLGWIEGETVSVTWPTGQIIGTALAPADGSISFDAYIPRTAAVGAYTVTASGDDKGSIAYERFRVENDSYLVIFDAPASSKQDACLDDWLTASRSPSPGPTTGSSAATPTRGPANSATSRRPSRSLPTLRWAPTR